MGGKERDANIESDQREISKMTFIESRIKHGCKALELSDEIILGIGEE